MNNESQVARLLLQYGVSRYEITDRQYGVCSKYGLLTLIVIKEPKIINEHTPFNSLGFGLVFRYEEE